MSKLGKVFIIVQSAILCILLIIAVIGMNNDAAKVEQIQYERIKADLEKVIFTLKQDIQIAKDETLLLIHKVDSIKEYLPKHEKNLNQIKNELKELNDVQVINYNDSTAAAILLRLSR